MKNLIIILLLLINNPFSSFAQGERIPFLSQGKYGIVDENGKKIIPCNFDNVVVEKQYKVIKVLQNDLWAIYNLDGVKVLDHIIKETKNYGTVGPAISAMKNKAGVAYYKEGAPTDLISIVDTYAKVKYLVNPNTPKSKNKAYSAKDKRSNKPTSLMQNDVINKYEVTNRDESITVVDSTGAEVLLSPVEDVYLLTEEYMAIGKNNLFALYKGNKQLTDYKYKSFSQLKINGLFYGRLEEDRGKSYPTKVYHLFDKDGKVIMESEKYIATKNDMILMQDPQGNSHIFDADANKRHTFQNKSARLLSIGKKAYVQITGDRYSGIYDMNGSTILDTIYDNIQSTTRFIHCRKKNTHSVLDSNFNTLIKCDSVSSIKGTNREGIFLYTVKGPNYTSMSGLMDKNQKTIVPAKWKSIGVYPCTDFVVLKSDSVAILRRLSDGKEFAKSGRIQISIQCEKEQITIADNKQRTTLDLEGNEIKVFVYKPMRQDRVYDTKYKAEKEGSKYILVDKDGARVGTKNYESIKIFTDPKTEKTAYFCAYAENVHPSVVVLDDNLNEIAQPGYSIAERWVRYMKANPGTIFVGNDADIKKDKYLFRSGIIDYNGNWIVRPFKGLFQYIHEDVYLVTNYDSKKHIFHNAKGEIVNTRDYDIIEERNGSRYFQNRIPVGVLQDRSYLEKLEKVAEKLDLTYDKDEDMEVTLEKLKKRNEKLAAVGKPDILYGYVTTKGVEVIPPKYIAASNFGMSEPTAIVSEKDNEGNISTHIIDTLGNVLFSVPYESLSELKNGYYSCKSNDFYGLVDSTATAKTPFIFTQNVQQISGFDLFTARDSLHRYIIDENFKKHPIELSDNIEVKKINEDFFYAKLQFKIPDTYKYNTKHLLFTKSLELIDTFENIDEIRTKFNNKELPNKYVVIRKRDNADVVYDIDRRELMQE